MDVKGKRLLPILCYGALCLCNGPEGEMWLEACETTDAITMVDVNVTEAKTYKNKWNIAAKYGASKKYVSFANLLFPSYQSEGQK